MTTDDTLTPATNGAATKPTKRKPRVTKKAAEIKDALERGQIGAEPAPEKPNRPKQAELDAVIPPPDKVGLAAIRFKDALEALSNAQDEKGAASENLIKALKKAKRYNYSVSGYKFELFHQGAKDTIKVQKPK